MKLLLLYLFLFQKNVWRGVVNSMVKCMTSLLLLCRLELLQPGILCCSVVIWQRPPRVDLLPGAQLFLQTVDLLRQIRHLCLLLHGLIIVSVFKPSNRSAPHHTAPHAYKASPVKGRKYVTEKVRNLLSLKTFQGYYSKLFLRCWTNLKDMPRRSLNSGIAYDLWNRIWTVVYFIKYQH